MLAEVAKLLEIGKALLTQHNAATSHPLFIVQQRKRDYGFSTDYCDDHVWIDTGNDCSEADSDKAKELDAVYDETGLEPDGWIHTGYRDRWVFVTACLTRAAAEQFIAKQAYNFTDPRVCVESGYRNTEWIDLRECLKSLARAHAAGVAAPEPSKETR